MSTAPLTYRDALSALQERGRFGIRLGLGRTRRLLAGLGNPERALRGVLVAGTNGKGSVLALASAALRAAGYRVGETPKPHLVSYRERLVVDGRPIDRDAFAALVSEIVPISNRVARRLGEPTEFELLTAVVFRWFAEQAVDVAVVEVGLGGRLDATHAWDGGVAAVTNVTLDHMDRLGPTVSAIAREKAAIIERGDLAVTGASGEALDVIRRRARRVGAPLVEVAPARVIEVTRDGLVVDLASLGEVVVGLRGRHQAANVAVANAILDALAEAGIAQASPEHRRSGFRDARWPGRLELIDVDGPAGAREVLLDGAHNEAGAAVLAAALDDLRPFLADGDAGGTRRVPLTLVLALMSDKDAEAIIRALAASRALIGAHVITTQVDAPRARPADGLAREWQAVTGETDVRSLSSPAAALDAALRAPGPVVVAGSLYLVGEIRGLLLPDPALDDAEPQGTAALTGAGARAGARAHGGRP